MDDREELQELMLNGWSYRALSDTTFGIIDVTQLPMENINESIFYRLLTCSFTYRREILNQWTCHCVNGLPQTGEACFSGVLSDPDTVVVVGYYNVQDTNVYAYVTDLLSLMFGVSAGWHPIEVLMSAIGYSFGGVVTEIKGDTDDGVFRLLLEYVIWQYKDKWTPLKSVGMRGIGPNAEIFNHLGNIASGNNSHAEGIGTSAYGNNSHAEGEFTSAGFDNSHAEGRYTSAGGDNSHAEGDSTSASGNNSHAEGIGTSAYGNNSHAEGLSTSASGNNSHAEGSETSAGGINSHAEGIGTYASGFHQHVQGRYNIEDTSDRYAHIVGNGSDFTSRSNAHTLDWEGNAWFQGTVDSAGILLTSPNGTRYEIKVSDDGTLTATAC